MPVSLIPSFLLYCFVVGITPGPANLCSLGAALRYGRGPALRQWQGLLCGSFLDAMGAVLVSWLLGTALDQYTGALSWVGAVYLLWLAWHILRSGSADPDRDPAAPSFRTGLLVNLTNVKVILFCISALGSYVLPYSRSFWALLAVGLLLPLIGPACNLVWLLAGASLQKLFARHRRAADIGMALSLALCAVSLVWPH